MQLVSWYDIIVNGTGLDLDLVMNMGWSITVKDSRLIRLSPHLVSHSLDHDEQFSNLAFNCV